MLGEPEVSQGRSGRASRTTAASRRRVLGANDRIGVGVIGCGLRGLVLGRYVGNTGCAEVRGVSDAYRLRSRRAAAILGPEAKTFATLGEILDCKDIDAVVISTPDHWHAEMATEAVRAGKDVYLEKPVTHSLEECDALLQAVERSGRVVASGTQQRSWNHFLEAKQLVDEGVLGRVSFVRCHWSQDYSRMRSGPSPPIEPDHLDWERWLGPAPMTPFDPARFRFWRCYWDYGGGSVADLMTHWIDVVQWFLDSPRAEKVQAASATYVQEWMETPDTVVATMQYPEGFMAVFEGNMTFGLLGCGIEFRGDRAMMSINRVGYWVYEEGTRPLESVTLPEPKYCFERSDHTSRDERVDGTGTLDNVRNWVDCIRDRKRPNADIQAAVDSAATAHWVNRAVRKRRPLSITP